MLTALMVCSILCGEARECTPEPMDISTVLPLTSNIETQLREVDMATKTCSKCRQSKSWDSFVAEQRAADGLTSACKECLYEGNRKWAANNAERLKRTARESYAKKPPEFSVWVAMKQRCRDPKHDNFKSYGGRGVVVCDRWMSFSNFLADMGPKPTPKHQIDRIDNDGNYEPSNCQWVTCVENQRKRTCVKLSMEKARAIRYQHHFGMVTVTELARDYGVAAGTISPLVNNKTWKEDAV